MYVAYGLMFSYRPGDVIIMRSSALYHKVLGWKPAIMTPNSIVTPGRVSWVYFSHKDSVNQLKDKMAGYAESTCDGAFGFLDNAKIQ